VIAMIQRDLSLSGTEIGLLSGIPVVVFAIFAAPGSIMVARIGVRGALLGGLVIAVAGTLLRTGASNAWQLYLTSVLMSVGIAIMQPSMAAAVREWLPQRSAFGTAVYTNGLIMGEIIPVATMLSLILPYFDDNWRAGARRVGDSADCDGRSGSNVRPQIGGRRRGETHCAVVSTME